MRLRDIMMITVLILVAITEPTNNRKFIKDIIKTELIKEGFKK
jgi:hypothetical protein